MRQVVSSQVVWTIELFELSSCLMCGVFWILVVYSYSKHDGLKCSLHSAEKDVEPDMWVWLSRPTTAYTWELQQVSTFTAATSGHCQDALANCREALLKITYLLATWPSCPFQWQPLPKFKPHNEIKTAHVHVWPIPDSALLEFGQWIAQHDWMEVRNEQDVQSKCNSMYATLNEKIDHHFPSRCVKLHCRGKPWMKSHIKSLIKKRQELFQKGKFAVEVL